MYEALLRRMANDVARGRSVPRCTRASSGGLADARATAAPGRDSS